MGSKCWYISCMCLFSLSRFRSIAKSYFRRADGVLLLYDVTCEKSFLNVREWVDMIEVMQYSPLLKGWMTDTVCISKQESWKLQQNIGQHNRSVLIYSVMAHQQHLCYYKALWVKVLSHIHLISFSLFTCSRYVSVGCKACAVVIMWPCWNLCDFFLFLHAVCLVKHYSLCCYMLCTICRRCGDKCQTNSCYHRCDFVWFTQQINTLITMHSM